MFKKGTCEWGKLAKPLVTEDDIIDDDCFEFLEVPSFVAVISYNSYEPAYTITIIKKGEVSEEIKYCYGHSIASREHFLRGSYLKPQRSTNISRKMFSLVPGMSSVIQTKYLKSLLTYR